MIHKKELKNIFYDEADSYANVGEYAVLVRDTSKEISPYNGLTEKDIMKKEIFVSTTEYWYLRWWDTKKNSYAFPYRETSRQQYVLRKDNGIWKVYETIRPSPRTSIPHRRQYL